MRAWGFNVMGGFGARAAGRFKVNVGSTRRRRTVGSWTAVTAATLSVAGLAGATASRYTHNGAIAFHSNRTGHFEIFAVSSNGSHIRQLTHTAPTVKNLVPKYSPDGKQIIFGSDRTGPFELYIAQADASHPRQLTTTPDGVSYNSPRFFPGSKRIVFISDRTGHNEVYVMNADGTHQQQITHTASTVNNFVLGLSPDGKTIALASNRTGHFEIHDDGGG